MSSSREDPGNAKLVQSVRRALWQSVPIRALNLDHMEIGVEGDRVELRGIVASPVLKYQAEQIARSVHGVREVKNLLITDEELERDIALALTSDPKLRKRRITVNVSGGVASLYGAVPTVEESEKGRDLALSVPGVAGVESKLHVLRLDSPVILAWQRSVEGRPVRRASASGSEAASGQGSVGHAAAAAQNTAPAPAEA